MAVLEMSLKSSIMSKLDHQMSRIWIEFASLDSKHVLKVKLKPSRKSPDFYQILFCLADWKSFIQAF